MGNEPSGHKCEIPFESAIHRGSVMVSEYQLKDGALYRQEQEMIDLHNAISVWTSDTGTYVTQPGWSIHWSIFMTSKLSGSRTVSDWSVVAVV